MNEILSRTLDQFDLIHRLEGFLWGLTSYLPRRRSHKGRKVGQLRVDGGVRSIAIDRKYTSGAEAEQMLAAAHIPIAGRRVTGPEAIFLVRARQAAWAELILLRGGAVLADTHHIIDPRNLRYAADNRGPVPLWGRQPVADDRTNAPTQARQPAARKGAAPQQSRKRRRGLIDRFDL